VVEVEKAECLVLGLEAGEEGATVAGGDETVTDLTLAITSKVPSCWTRSTLSLLATWRAPPSGPWDRSRIIGSSGVRQVRRRPWGEP